jgi:hypothetical protein
MPSSKSIQTSRPGGLASGSPSWTRPSRTPGSRAGRSWKRRFPLPDPEDRHVLATALRGRADAIITTNVRHYPTDTIEPLGIEVIHPDHFLLDQLDLAPRIVLDVLREQAANARRPRLSPIDLIARLAKAGVPKFAYEAGRLI